MYSDLTTDGSLWRKGLHKNVKFASGLRTGFSFLKATLCNFFNVGQIIIWSVSYIGCSRYITKWPRTYFFRLYVTNQIIFTEVWTNTWFCRYCSRSELWQCDQCQNKETKQFLRNLNNFTVELIIHFFFSINLSFVCMVLVLFWTQQSHSGAAQNNRTEIL